MRYLITQGQFSPPFFTDNFDPENHWQEHFQRRVIVALCWSDNFDPENHWQEHVDMVVYDLNCSLYTIDGKAWKPIAIDGL